MRFSVSLHIAGFCETWQWEWRELARTSPRWSFHQRTEPAPWVSQVEIDEARRRNPASRFARLWQGVWSSGTGDALAGADIDAALHARRGPMAPKKPGYRLVAALDVGISRDSTAFVIVAKKTGAEFEVETEPREKKDQYVPRHILARRELGMLPDPAGDRDYTTRRIRGTGRLRVAYIKAWTPGDGRRVDLGEVQRHIVSMYQRYRFEVLGYDPYQAVAVAQALGERDIPTREIPFTGGNLGSMASAVLTAFSERRIDAWPHDGLSAELRSLRVEERSYGWRLVSPRRHGSHGDIVSSLAMCLHLLQEFTAPDDYDPDDDTFVSEYESLDNAIAWPPDEAAQWMRRYGAYQQRKAARIERRRRAGLSDQAQ